MGISNPIATNIIAGQMPHQPNHWHNLDAKPTFLHGKLLKQSAQLPQQVVAGWVGRSANPTHPLGVRRKIDQKILCDLLETHCVQFALQPRPGSPGLANSSTSARKPKILNKFFVVKNRNHGLATHANLGRNSPLRNLRSTPTSKQNWGFPRPLLRPQSPLENGIESRERQQNPQFAAEGT